MTDSNKERFLTQVNETFFTSQPLDLVQRGLFEDLREHAVNPKEIRLIIANLRSRCRIFYYTITHVKIVQQLWAVGTIR